MSKHPKNQAGKNSILKTKPFFVSDKDTLHLRKIYRLHNIRYLTPSTYVMRVDRNGMEFNAGQYITLGIPGNNQVREYSIYSAESDESLEVLIKAVDEGSVSKQLHHLISGELLDVDGPFGFFTIDPARRNEKFLFVATGTGISPFHSMAGSYPGLNYTVLHGVRTADEAYERDWFAKDRYVLCTTRSEEGDYLGRVTDYIKENTVETDTLVYLCGNCDMIYDVYDLLTSRGFPVNNIKTEVYF